MRDSRGLSTLTQLFQNLSRCVHLSPGGEGRKLGQNTQILLFSFNRDSALVFPDCSHHSGGLWMKWSTDYDSLNARFFFLWEQMLLQPFKVIVGAVNVVLPRSSQLQMQQSRQHGCLMTRQLFNPQIRLASGSRQLFVSPFQIQSGRSGCPRLSPPPWPSRYGRGRSEQTPQQLLPPGIIRSSTDATAKVR